MLRLSCLPSLHAAKSAFRVGFLHQLTNQDIPHRHAQRLPSEVIPDFVKLTARAIIQDQTIILHPPIGHV